MIREIRDIVLSDAPVFAKLSASLLIPFSGYRFDAMKREFPEIAQVLRRISETDISTVSRYAAALEAGTVLQDPSLVRKAMSAARRSIINPKSLAAISCHYRPFSLPFNRWVGRFQNLLTLLIHMRR